MTPEEFAARLSVSRETMARLETYTATLESWQRRINLVGRATLDDIWRRHFLDSAQLLALIGPAPKTVVDFGSGAGFPGMVIAMMAAHRVFLVESNRRKCAFLREVARQTRTPVEILSVRIETLKDLAVDVVTARACAPLDTLLEWSENLRKPDGTCLFLKGARWQEELTDSQKKWKIALTREDSISDPTGVILKIGEFHRRHGH